MPRKRDYPWVKCWSMSQFPVYHEARVYGPPREDLSPLAPDIWIRQPLIRMSVALSSLAGAVVDSPAVFLYALPYFLTRSNVLSGLPNVTIVIPTVAEYLQKNFNSIHNVRRVRHSQAYWFLDAYYLTLLYTISESAPFLA